MSNLWAKRVGNCIKEIWIKARRKQQVSIGIWAHQWQTTNSMNYSALPNWVRHTHTNTSTRSITPRPWVLLLFIVRSPTDELLAWAGPAPTEEGNEEVRMEGSMYGGESVSVASLHFNSPTALPFRASSLYKSLHASVTGVRLIEVCGML